MVSSLPLRSSRRARVSVGVASRLQCQPPTPGHPGRASVLLLLSAEVFRWYPQCYSGDPKVLDYFHELPKSSIEIIKIKKIVTPSKNSPTFEIFFDNRNLMDREDIRKTLTS